MIDVLYLAFRYLARHRVKTFILVTAITLILYLPVGLEVLVDQSAQQLTARAAATPLVVGAKGSPLELVLSALYFRADPPESIPWSRHQQVAESGLAQAIPIHARFHARSHPIIGTTADYIAFRRLRMASGRSIAVLGDCVLGARVADALGAKPGDFVISSPESVFDLAGVYPLKMPVVGVLAPSGTPDDRAIFVDVKTTWIIAGLAHGHEDLSRPEAEGGVLVREGSRIVANASVKNYREIRPDNVDAFHFHGDVSGYPITAVIAVPRDAKASAILRGRYEGSGESVQIVRPRDVIDDLLETILTIRGYVVAGIVVVGVSTLATIVLVLMLSLRARRREIETLTRIGGSRPRVAAIMVSEIVAVVVAGALLAGVLTWLTSHFGPRAVLWLVS